MTWHRLCGLILALMLGGVLCAPVSGASSAEDTRLFGVWRNPGNSVHVEIMACAESICGVVVWASEKARRDARKGGTETLVGTGLLQDLTRVGPDSWRGKVFVPDLRRTVTGTVTLMDASRFRARSCALGVICKSQVWQRVR